jgi:hypothetical protein
MQGTGRASLHCIDIILEKAMQSETMAQIKIILISVFLSKCLHISNSRNKPAGLDF